MDTTSFHEIVGNVHLHTQYSDGSGSFEEIADAARKAGLDFVIPTDHNILKCEHEGYYEGLLLLIGEETNDPEPPQANHLLCFDIKQDVASFAGDPQKLIDNVKGQGGFCFLAHPCERPAPFIREPAFDWTHWHVNGFAGISIWNYMSEFKSYLTNLPRTLWAVFFPETVIRGPFPETLALYDRLLSQSRPVALIGASDAHANRYSFGPFSRVVFPYQMLFHTVNLHLLIHRPMRGEVNGDKETLYTAMRAGRGFVGYHALGDPRGFRFFARGERGLFATFGETLHAEGKVTFEIRSPIKAQLRLLRDGKAVAEGFGKEMQYTTSQGGIYRVEAYRHAWFRHRGWVFTNPIYLQQPEREKSG